MCTYEEECLKFDQDKLFLFALGVTAKALVEEMFLKGYRVIDIGNLDMEYEWFLRKAVKKEPIPKHSIVGRPDMKNICLRLSAILNKERKDR